MVYRVGEGSTGGVRLKAESGEKGEAVGQVFEGFARLVTMIQMRRCMSNTESINNYNTNVTEHFLKVEYHT